MVAVKLPDIVCGPITQKSILSIRVLEQLVILVGCKTKGLNELAARNLKIHLVDYAHYNSVV